MFTRKEFSLIKQRVTEPRRFIQVVLGPRQIGKTTVVRQVLETLDAPSLYYSADAVAAADASWLSSCWETARVEYAKGEGKDFLLVIDEIQKVPNWSETVKREWDADTWNARSIKLLLLGSSRALVMSGLSESLTGRFEEIRMTHWTYSEMHEAYGTSLDQYIWYGGYPGPAFLIPDQIERWKAYIQSSVIDSTVNRDVLEDGHIANLALLRKTLELGIAYSGKILSLTKLLGQLQDRGNVSTIAGYLEKLNTCGLLGTLSKYSNDEARKKASIPKFQVHNSALLAACSALSFEEARAKPDLWGRVLESAVGAYLISQSFRSRFGVSYWREGDKEVDFVLSVRGKTIALEVKSNGEKRSAGLSLFQEKFRPNRCLVVGEGGLSLESFFELDPVALAD